MAGLLFLWLCLEGMVPDIAHKHVALFSDNLPTVSWVEKMASRKSRIAARLVRSLALCLNVNRTCPLMPVHIPGVENALTVSLKLLGLISCENLWLLIARHSALQERGANDQVIRSLA